MDWLLAALAIFNLVSMITVFSPRAVPRRSVPWAVFGTALLATELAWIWLPLQVILAWLLIDAGALDSGLGVAALLVLLATWPGLVWSIRQSTLAENTVEQALQADLGPEYRGDIPAAASQNLRNEVSWRDWWNPLTMKRPGVEVIRHVPYGPHGVRQQLDIYRPSHIPPEGCPVSLQIHGGAWMIGSPMDMLG